jgi:hypothetical protein
VPILVQSGAARRGNDLAQPKLNPAEAGDAECAASFDFAALFIDQAFGRHGKGCGSRCF